MRKVVAADDESYVRDKKPLPLRLLSWERFLRLLVCKFLFHYLKISVCNATEDSTWISNSDDIVGNIFGNYAAGADNGIRADFDTGKYDAISTEPYIISDENGEGSLNFAVALYRVDWMLGSIKCAIGSNKHMISEGDHCVVHKEAIAVSKEVVSNL